MSETEADNNKIGALVGYGVDRIHVIKGGEAGGKRKNGEGKNKGWKRNKNVWAGFVEVIRMMGEGDKVVIGSLRDVCGEGDRRTGWMVELLLMVAERKFELISLDEKWFAEGVDMVRDGDKAADLRDFLMNLSRFGDVKNNEGDGRERKKVEGKVKDGGGEIKESRSAASGGGGGRPKGSIKMTEGKLDLAVKMYCQGDFTVKDICRIVKCNERSMYRYLQMKGVAGKRKVAGMGKGGDEARSDWNGGNGGEGGDEARSDWNGGNGGKGGDEAKKEYAAGEVRTDLYY